MSTYHNLCSPKGSIYLYCENAQELCTVDPHLLLCILYCFIYCGSNFLFNYHLSAAPIHTTDDKTNPRIQTENLGLIKTTCRLVRCHRYGNKQRTQRRTATRQSYPFQVLNESTPSFPFPKQPLKFDSSWCLSPQVDGH